MVSSSVNMDRSSKNEQQAELRPSSSSSDYRHETRHPFFVPRRRRRNNRRRRGEIDGRTSVALELNNAAVTLLESGQNCEESAIDALRDSIEVLASPPDKTHGAPVLALAWGEARLDLASREAKEAVMAAKTKKSKSCRGRGSKEQQETQQSCTSSAAFVCAQPIRMRSPRRDCDCAYGGGGAQRPGLQGLLSVISYNLGLAHQLLGARLGRQALVNKATQFYKKSEAIVLSIADATEEEEDNTGGGDVNPLLLPPGVDATYLARAIVNNMGLILFEWGEPNAARDYFDGLNSIRVDLDQRRREISSEGDDEKEDGESRWHAFAVNELIARGAISSPAA